MYKSQIIKDLVENKVSLQRSVSRLQVIAHEIHNKELEKWAEDELLGYSENAKLPKYRKTISYDFKYSGINNYSFNVEKARLDLSFISENSLDKIKNVFFREGIEYLEAIAKEEKVGINRDCTFLAKEIKNKTNGKLQCVTIIQIIPISFIKDLIANVKNITLKTLLKLEDEFGNLDELGVHIEKTTTHKMQKINYEIYNNVIKQNIDDSHANKESVPNKICWNIISPTIVAIVAGVIVAVIVAYLNFT